MAKTVADIFIETLVNAGVKRVYGVVGDSLNGLTDVIRTPEQDQMAAHEARGGSGIRCRR